MYLKICTAFIYLTIGTSALANTNAIYSWQQTGYDNAVARAVLDSGARNPMDGVPRSACQGTFRGAYQAAMNDCFSKSRYCGGPQKSANYPYGYLTSQSTGEFTRDEATYECTTTVDVMGSDDHQP